MHITKPGTYPAINIFATDTLAIKEYIIKFIPGGITGVIAEEAAVIAAENYLEYPLFVISGTNILHSMAASAFAEPDIPPIKVLNNTFT